MLHAVDADVCAGTHGLVRLGRDDAIPRHTQSGNVDFKCHLQLSLEKTVHENYLNVCHDHAFAKKAFFFFLRWR